MALNISAYFRQRQPLELKEAYDGINMVLYSSEGGLDPDRVRVFLDHNAEAFEFIYGLPHAKHLPNFVPEWSGTNINDFYAMAELAGKRIGVSEQVATDETIMRYVLSFCRKSGIDLVVSSSKGTALQHSWSDVILGSWVAASKHRELQVWDGKHVARYSRANRADGTERHMRQIENLGVDPQAVLDDDSDALMQVAVRSWLLYGQQEARVVDISMAASVRESAQEQGHAIAIAPTPPRKRDSALIPVLGREQLAELDADGNPVQGPLRVNRRALKACDGCLLSRHCTSFEAGAECAFEIPVEIKTKNDVAAVYNAFLEMQAQRIFFERLAEELLGQGTSQVLSQELERFGRIAESQKRFQETTDTLMIKASSSSGAISRLFGAEAGEANTRLANPIQTKQLDQAIIDADVFGDDS